MKNQKGFTLIELLAVVVILAIIALIATPLIANIINDARKGAFKNTAYGILEAGKLSYTNEILKSGKIDSAAFTYADGVETSNPAGKKLEYKGTKPKSGIVVVNDAGKIALALYDGQFCAEKGYDDVAVTISTKNESQCTIVFNADLSGAPAPELATNMIPIKWNGSSWIKADINNIQGSNQWYDYTAQQWANAVLVTSTSRTNYINASVGTAIDEADVLAYLVWVPRYKYKLFNVGAIAVAVQKIDVTFENKTVTKSNGTTDGDYLTHPAFTFGTTELNGFWVGKFEVTGDATTPTVKPNVTSLTNQTVSVQFSTAQKFSNVTTYGLTAANDAHTIKNMEWGAVAYLSQSNYGKYGNATYTGAAGLEKEIYINNISTVSGGPAITGCAGSSVSAANVISATCPGANQYHTTQGVKASTTGNIYGIYDMSGGSGERSMGMMYNSGNTTIFVQNSGFAQATIDSAAMAKYVNKYNNGTALDDQTSYNRRLLGDATGEVRAWNGDNAQMVGDTWPCMRRGFRNTDASLTGIFAFGRSDCSAAAFYGFHVTIIGG